MHGPASIVPEPIEEFADEPGGTPDSVPQITSRPTLERIPLPALEPDLPLIPRTVPLAERPLLIRPPVEPPPIYYPSRPRTVGQTLLPVFQGTVDARLRGGVRVARGDALSARRRDRDGGSGRTGVGDGGIACLRRPQPLAPDSTPPAPLRPAQLQTADVTPATLPEPEPATQPPGRAAACVRSASVASSRAADEARGLCKSRRKLARSTPDTKKPDVVAAARTAATAPVTPEADSRRATPTPDVSRVQTDTVSGLGQPVSPPAAEPAPLAASRDRAAAPAPAPEAPARPVPTSGNTVTDIRSADRDKVRSVLSRYESAYSQLDAAAAARLYPGVDRKALSRAFGTLSSQQIQFDDCRILVTQSTASATCAGKASWTPKVGGGAKEQARRWQFDLKQVAGDWQIGSVRVQ